MVQFKLKNVVDLIFEFIVETFGLIFETNLLANQY